MTSAAGWYPDPDGSGGQRYFDGTNWGPTAPAAPAVTAPLPPPPSGKKKPGGCAMVFIGLFILFVIGAIGNACDDHNNKATSSSSSSSSSSSPRAPAPSSTDSQATSSTDSTPTPTGPTKPSGTFVTGPDGSVTVTFAIGDNFTEGMIKDGARFDTIDILKYTKAVYPNAPQVEVKGTFPMKDSYGNTTTDTVIDLIYLRSTIDKINFDGVDKDKIWELRDSGIVYPAFQP